MTLEIYWKSGSIFTLIARMLNTFMLRFLMLIETGLFSGSIIALVKRVSNIIPYDAGDLLEKWQHIHIDCKDVEYLHA